MAESSAHWLDHGTAERALLGQARCGDRALVVEFYGGALVAVIDGLGHGEEAADASAEAAEVLADDPGEPLVELVRHCHERLRTTRGAAMTLARIEVVGRLAWIGIGNVDAVLVRALGGSGDEGILAVGGIVGYQLPALRVRELALEPGDTIVLASDGIDHGFRAEVTSLQGAQPIADRILDRFASGRDDASVAVARYRGRLGDANRIDVDGEAGVAEARIRTRDRARSLGFAAADVEALATAVSELARNIVVHAGSGEVLLRALRDGARVGLAVIARDRGPGIADLQQALAGAHSTSGGLGAGLAGARRFVDDLRVETEPGVGTVVTITKWLK